MATQNELELLKKLDREVGVLVNRVDEIRANQQLVIERLQRTEKDIADFKSIYSFSRGVHWVLLGLLGLLAFAFHEMKGLVIK